MSSSPSAEFRRVDRNDPALAVDTLIEFWPANAESDDQMLSFGSEHEWFAARPAKPVPEPHASLPDPMLELGDFDHFDVRVVESDGDDDFVGVEGLSETQRAARDFQRFAEQFHAFATAAASGDCRCGSRR